MSDEGGGGRRVECFEDLAAWRKARELTKAVYEVTAYPRSSRDIGLSGQIQRVAVSVMSNIAEGYERGSRAEFARFLFIAKASCAEVRSQLYVAWDIGYVDEADFKSLLTRAEEVSRIIGGLRSAVERSGAPR